MNRLLADTLSFLNGLIAGVIIIAGCAIGYFSLYFAGQRVVGLVIGGLAGLVVAAFLCGIIAYLALIEHHLREISEGRSGTLGRSRDTRQEPRL